MRGPIDYVVVGFEGNNFNGSILAELSTAVASGAIAVLDISLISKDADGKVTAVELSDSTDPAIQQFAHANAFGSGLITEEDVAEVADIVENNTSIGLLVIEQLWAKGLKKSIIDAGGVLVAEGRIHPDAAEEINNKGE